MEKLQLEGAGPTKAPDLVTRWSVQRLEGSSSQEKGFPGFLVLGHGLKQQLRSMAGKSQALEVLADPGMAINEPERCEGWSPSPELKAHLPSHEEIHAAKALATLPNPGHPHIESPPVSGQQGDDSVGFTHIHLPKNDNFEGIGHRLNQAMEIKK